MSLEEQVVEGLKTLPVEKQQEVLDFVQFLASKTQAKRPLRNPLGMCADLPGKVTAEDIDEARREMWGNFPREDI